jgi:hypothetical protein
MMYKNKTHRDRVLRAANAEPVKSDLVWWGIGIVGLIALIYTVIMALPSIPKNIDSLHPLTQAWSFIAFCLTVFYITRRLIK